MLVALAAGASADPLLPGDLDGDGRVDAADEAWLVSLYGAASGDPAYAPPADLDGNGRIDVSDLARFGAGFGAAGGAVDASPPALLVTLNDVPDDMNDLLVVPPEGFEITLAFDALAGSVIDPASLSVRSTQAIGAHAAGTELAPQFSVGQQRAVWRIPPGSDLARTAHFLTASVRDAAGNSTGAQVFGFAVRDFALGPPLGGDEQLVFLDFEQNRSLGPAPDFLEDLRVYGLASASAPALEEQMRSWAKAEILARTHAYFGRAADGSPGPDPVNVRFVASPPQGPHSRLCIGGASSLGASYLGASILDTNNLNRSQDDCARGSQYGVFPQAIQALWGNGSTFKAIFDPLMPSRGGTPVGQHLLDAVVLAPGFDPDAAPAAQLARYAQIVDALDAFAQSIATATAHEVGHYLGLVAHGPTPGGLFGGTSGAGADHNVTASGGVPTPNYIMNPGGSFTFKEVAGRDGTPLPVFRPLNRAYLRNRTVLDATVSGLYPPPVLAAVAPSVVDLDPPDAASVTLQGTGFQAPAFVDLLTEGDPTPNALVSVVVASPTTITGVVNRYLVPPALYDVRVTNGDGQVAVLPDALEVR